MTMSLRTGWIAVALLLAFLFCVNAQAAEVKIGVFDSGRVNSESTYLRTSQQRFEARMKQLQAQLKPEQDALNAMAQDLQKKSSALSDKAKAEKVSELQRRGGELQSKFEKGRADIYKSELGPVEKALHDIVADIGKSGSYTMIADARGVLYFDKSIDLSDTIIKRLNATLK
jgi:outer membrane protein